MLGLATDVAAHAGGAGDTPWWLILGYSVGIAVPGALLVAVAWRYRRPPSA